jgi:integrase
MAKAIKLPSGNWHIKVYDYTDGNGKRHYEPFTDPDKNTVEYLAAEFKLNKRRKSRPGNMTIGEAIDAYIKSKDGILSPTTISGYKKIRRCNVQGLMLVYLKDIEEDTIQNEINKEAKKISPRTKKKLSPKTIANTHGLISAALDVYYPSLTIKTSLPAKDKKIIELPSASNIFKAVVGSEVELPCMFAMWMSYSMSEVRGIKISSIADDGHITIKDVIVDVDGKPFEKEKTKAYARTRRAKLPLYLFNLIKEQETYKIAKETGIDGYLITMSGKGIYNRFVTAQKHAGLNPIRFHDLRHMNASVMLQLNIPDKYAMERGGWITDYTLKKVYQHTFSDERKAVDDKIDLYFEGIMQHEMQHDPKQEE